MGCRIGARRRAQADGGAVMAAAVALPRRTDEGVILPPIIEHPLPMGTGTSRNMIQMFIGH